MSKYPYSPPDANNYRHVAPDYVFSPLKVAPKPGGVVHLSTFGRIECGLLDADDGDSTTSLFYHTSCEACLKPNATNSWAKARLDELRARNAVDPAAFPHRCPGCGAPAYLGLVKVDCSAKCSRGGMP